MDTKTRPLYILSTKKTHLKTRDTYRLKVKGWKKIFHANRDQKKAGVPNIGAPQYVRQMLTSLKGEINNNTIIVGDFNTPLTPMDRSTKQKGNTNFK